MSSKIKSSVRGVRNQGGSILVLATALAAAGCSPGISPNQATATSAAVTNSAALAASLKLSVADASHPNTPVFTDGAFTTFKLVQGKNYVATVTGANVPAGSVLTLELHSTGVVGASTISVTLNPVSGAAQTWSGALPAGLVPANYNTKLVLSSSAGELASKKYVAAVSCATPVLTGGNVYTDTNAAHSGTGVKYVSVTPKFADVYDFNASAAGTAAAALVQSSGNASGANDTFYCALDYTGIGAVDGDFQPCSQVHALVQANYVGKRNIAVVVQETNCNSYQTFITAVQLDYTPDFMYGVSTSSMPQDNFIFGQIVGTSGPDMADARVGGGTAANGAAVPGVNYLATDTVAPYNRIVVAANKGNSSTMTGFSIESGWTYAQTGVASPVKFGMDLGVTFGTPIDTASVLTSICGSGAQSQATCTAGANAAVGVNITAGTSLDASYTTDQLSDKESSIALNSSSCTTTQVWYKPQAVMVGKGCGTICGCGAGNAGGSGWALTIDVWGDYSCNAKDNSGANTATIKGTFNGAQNITGDNCMCTPCGGGGQGQGGGGSAPGAS